ncbi:MAG TPA: cytochrome c [Burkholderiales bacterium]|nr:cytochrome c [Burkholderiales bacterium]
MRRLALLLVPAIGLCAAGALAQESKVKLQDGPGKDKAMQCAACHSADYIPMNSRFLDKAGWTATTNKMINAFGAPIAKEDVEPIATYLAEHYGKPAQK